MKKILITLSLFALMFTILIGCTNIASFYKTEWTEEEKMRVHEGIVGSWESEDGNKQFIFEAMENETGKCKYRFKTQNDYSETEYSYSWDENILVLSNANRTVKYAVNTLTDDNSKLILIDENNNIVVYQAFIY